jgi:hypothetical protein
MAFGKTPVLDIRKRTWPPPTAEAPKAGTLVIKANMLYMVARNCFMVNLDFDGCSMGCQLHMVARNCFMVNLDFDGCAMGCQLHRCPSM